MSFSKFVSAVRKPTWSCPWNSALKQCLCSIIHSLHCPKPASRLYPFTGQCILWCRNSFKLRQKVVCWTLWVHSSSIWLWVVINKLEESFLCLNLSTIRSPTTKPMLTIRKANINSMIIKEGWPSFLECHVNTIEHNYKACELLFIYVPPFSVFVLLPAERPFFSHFVVV